MAERADIFFRNQKKKKKNPEKNYLCDYAFLFCRVKIIVGSIVLAVNVGVYILIMPPYSKKLRGGILV